MTVSKLKILNGKYVIHRLDKTAAVPAGIFECEFYNISKTDEELSIICPTSLALESKQYDEDWACIKVLGPLDFSLTGILAKLSGILAKAEISIFAISTFDTDYILVKAAKLSRATSALESAGYEFIKCTGD